jgi:hypothetical protein
MANDDLSALIPTLLRRTLEGKLNWERLTSTSYIVRIGEAIFEAASDRDDNPRVSLLSAEGDRLDSISWQASEPPLDIQISQLYDAARNQALGVSKALNQAKRLLDEL